MCKRSLALVIGLLLVFLGDPPADAGKTVLGLSDIHRLEPNGRYVISVRQSTNWKQAGTLTFDRFFREREMNIGPLVRSERNIEIRLEQQGGGAAHVDSISLGGMPPSSVKGSENISILKKVSSKDFDVTDAFNKTFDFSFEAAGHDRMLRLTARVEGETPDDTPFQFPTANLYKDIDQGARFYTYTLNSHTGSSTGTEGLQDMISSRRPFFAEFCSTGSGHPSGYTYGWVGNDDENLHVTLDFTPDNTLDGDKDYAKVYVRTETGLKEFKVSEDDSVWGEVHFTYTDKVPYEHKLYNFKIPLDEIGVKNEGEREGLHLAFAAYGTALPGNYSPSIAYDPHNNRYLAVYTMVDDENNWDIYGRFTNNEGSPIGADIVISDFPSFKNYPSVAYDGMNQRFLVVWEDRRGQSGSTANDIYGQLVNGNGVLYSTGSTENFAICNREGEQVSPAAAYDTSNKRYLVVWEDHRNTGTTDNDIYGQLVNANGTLYGAASNVNFAVCDKDENQYDPAVAYDTVNRKFLVVWEDERDSGATNRDIYGQLVNSNGALHETGSDVNFVIDGSPGYQFDPVLAYNSNRPGFLVAFVTSEFTPSDVAFRSVPMPYKGEFYIIPNQSGGGAVIYMD